MGPFPNGQFMDYTWGLLTTPRHPKCLLRLRRCLDGMFLGAPPSYLETRLVFGCLGYLHPLG